jgi:hypothetical protein
VALALVVGSSACGPIEYLSQVAGRAAAAVDAAKLAHAERFAPYELTAAEEYLHKAREEGAYAQYQDAIEYGRKSEEMANRARAMALARQSRPAGEPPAGGADAAGPAREGRGARDTK